MSADNNSAPHDLHDLSPEVEDHFERVKEYDEVRRTFLARPRVSLRLQLLLGFLLVFVFALGITATIVTSMYKVENKVQFLEIVSDYVLEIEQARRFEKNFFLYGTDLGESLDSVYKARAILEGNDVQLSKVIGTRHLGDVLQNIAGYERLLERISELQRSGTLNEDKAQAQELSIQLRKLGKQMVLLAQDLQRKERRSIERAVASSLRIQLYLLVSLLLFVITTAVLISGSIVRNIERYELYTQRIAGGDFTPITPTRRYRDEFTDLSMAINDMVLEIQKHEAMLIQAHKMKAIGTLTAGVAHELNNPLNNITLTTHMLLEDFSALTDEERREMVQDVIKEGDRAKKIVSNLLDFTRESETKLQPLDLVSLVSDTIELLANQIKIAGIKVELSTMEEPPRILGDSQQLIQVFLNLILNAIAASSRGGKIQILVHPSDERDNLSVKVIDYGTGIPKHILDRVWDPFFTTKERGKGTGLGLSVSQGIIAKHGGRMLVDSREGIGSTFTVILPVTMLT